MFTVTQDVVLPTTVTGSWPRPQWFTENLARRQLSSAMVESAFREQFSDALATVISDQQRAGLDILTTGDYHCDNDFFGRSWANYPLERIDGLEGDDPPPASRWDLEQAFPPGTLLNEIFTDWLGPTAVREIDDDGRRLEYARIWSMAQSRAVKPVRFGAISAQALPGLIEVDPSVYDDDRRQVLWDLAGAMNGAWRELAARGCKVIQLEEPNFHFGDGSEPEDELSFQVDAFNREVEGLDNVEVWVHTCFGNPNMQRVFKETRYRQEALAIYLERLNCDVLTVEMKDRGYADLEVFGEFRESLSRKVAIGVVSHRTLQVEDPEEVARDVREALRFIDPEKLILTSDCGFGRQGCTRGIALHKAASIALGANVVKRELGVPETPVPLAEGAPEAPVTSA